MNRPAQRAREIVNELLAGLTPDEARSLISAAEQAGAEEEARRLETRRLLLEDREAAEAQARSERVRNRENLRKQLKAKTRQCEELRSEFVDTRRKLIALAGAFNDAIEEHRILHASWAALVDREDGAMSPQWVRPARWDPRDAIPVRDLERMRGK